MTTFAFHTARLVRSVPFSDYARHLEFEMMDLPRFDFVAGQWVSIRHVKPDGEEITRAYSIASPPTEDKRFELCVNRVENGYMSNFLNDMKEGDEIRCKAPFGAFILKPPLHDTMFIATGTGVAPFRSMLHWMLPHAERHQGKHFSLVFGSRYENDVYYYDEFKELEAKYPNFHFLPTLSRGSESWKGLRGYVQDHVPAVVQGRTDMHTYICGLEKMVTTNRDLLKSLGWDRKQIHFERYD